MEIATTLNTYPIIENLNPILCQFSNDYILENGVFFSKNPPNCPCCGNSMVHNGYNTVTKKNIATLKIGKYRCLNCKKNIQESREFFVILLEYLRENIVPMILKMRWNKMSYRGIEEVLEHILPMGKDTIYELIQTIIESASIPEQKTENFQVIGYDEQYVRINGKQKYRILIFNLQSLSPIIDTIVESKNSENIKEVFLQSGIDFLIPTIVVTDLDNSYPRILDELFGKNLIHQPCLFHLQKLIFDSYSKNCSISDELLKYRLLNIFYDHEQEIEWLTSCVDQEQEMIQSRTKKEYQEWLKQKKQEFQGFCKNCKSNEPRKKKEKVRTFEQIMDNLLNLIEEIEKFPSSVQKRLKMMDKMFLKLTNFCDSGLIPTTNNVVENYFFRTLNMDWKKRMRTDKGFLFHLKLQAIRLSGIFSKVSLKFTDLFCLIRIFCGSY